MREDEIACRSLGINTTNTKLTAFAIGAMFGGFAGSFFAARQGFISPESFIFLESATDPRHRRARRHGLPDRRRGRRHGVMIGGTEMLRELDFLKPIFGPDFDPTQYRMLLFGVRHGGDHGLAAARPDLGAVSRRCSSRSARASPATWSRRGTADDAAGRPIPILDVEHLTMRFGGLVAVDDLSFAPSAATSPP